MKKILFAAMMFFSISGAFALEPNPGSSILKAFQREFPHAQHIRWIETEDTYQAKFSVGESRYWLLLDKKTGEREYLVSYYSGDGLRPELQKALLDNFPKTTITGVTEISDDHNRVYQVNLDAKNTWYIVLMDDDGHVTLKNKFHKGR